MVLKSIDCLLSDGTTCKIDIGFYLEFKKHNWCINNYGYIYTRVPINGQQQTLLLHHLVMDFKYDPNIDLMIDHKYGNKRDARKKKLREVSRSTNNLNNSGYDTNTGFSRIHCIHDYKNNRYYYQVSYININKLPDNRRFRYIPGENEEDAFLKAFEFYEYTLTLPHYVEARPNPDDESSSGESIFEPNYEFSVNIKRLRPNNTSKEENIRNNEENSRWVVYYYNTQGNRTSQQFLYKPRSTDTKEEAFLKAIKFRDEHKNNRSITKKKPINNTNINITINNNIVKTKKKKKPINNNNININVNITNVDKIKKKKKPIPKLKESKSNIEDDGTTSPENEDTESFDEFRHEYNKFNRKNILEKSRFDMLIDENTPNPKSLFDLLLEENSQKPKKIMPSVFPGENNHTKRTLFDILIDENTHSFFENGNVSREDSMTTEYYEGMDIETKQQLYENDSDSATLTMSEEEINGWKLTGNPNFNNDSFILKDSKNF